ncbi:MAG: GAF domain-containing protein [Candidatus Krumholzibacteria bacterium]|nr:GAF domain-containing protein [Candidatus Krumholzibacteria bacterium]
MADIIKWPVVLVCPGEEELSLLADLSARRDARIVAVVDPDGTSVGAGLAEVMGLPVISDLAELTPGVARYLIHPPLNDTISAFADLGPDYGLETISAKDFSLRFTGPKAAPIAPAILGTTTEEQVDLAFVETDPPAQSPTMGQPDQDLLELETAAIHRTLSRIEEALDREALLRWLLSLATRATGASSGSIMLFDDRSEELYVAYAYGLSQHTMHTTRVRLGEGIAGRVAETRTAELITDNRHPGARRDRSAIQQAICAPIIWDGEVLGVVNVSNNDGDGQLDRGALATIESLTHRFGMILDRFLGLQLVRNSELFRNMEEELNRDTGHPQAVASTLCDWADDLRSVSGAEVVRLEVLTNSGDLFWADADQTGYESPPHPDKAEVLSSGRPLVRRPSVKQSSQASDESNEATVFHLPVGREPLRALITLEFASAARAHQFHAVSAEIIYLVNRHLTTFLDRAATADQVDRLTTLATALSELASGAGQTGFRDRVLSAACRLTGASEALLLTGVNDAPTAGENLSDEEALRLEAVRLLSDAGTRGWQTTVLESTGVDTPRTLLVVPLDVRTPFPGLVLLDKRRLHPLDGATFTEFDALFARRLLPLLNIPSEECPTINSDDTDAIVDRLVPETAAPEEFSAVTKKTLDGILQREMDRCDRYHTMLGLAAFRIAGEHEVQPARLVAEIDRRLRSSDHIGCLEDGTILIIVPEDIQSLPRLQRRVAEILTLVTGAQELQVLSATRVYPGSGDTPAKLMTSVLGALPPAK